MKPKIEAITTMTVIGLLFAIQQCAQMVLSLCGSFHNTVNEDLVAFMVTHTIYLTMIMQHIIIIINSGGGKCAVIN